MTIDEKIYALRNAPERHVLYKGKTTVEHLIERDIVEEVIKDLKELKWYREQYLIKREDALERIEHLKSVEKHFDHVIILHHSYCAIAEMPKAEPKYSGCGHDMFCEKTDCKGCEAEPKENEQ